MSTVSFNATTPSGRAILHLLDKSALADVTDGIELKTSPFDGRVLVMHPQWEDVCSDGEGALVAFLESLNGQGHVDLRLLIDALDDRSQRACAEALLIATGFRGATIVQVPA